MFGELPRRSARRHEGGHQPGAVAEEIAKAVVFLASDEAAFTVGSELIVDGGMSTL